MIVFITEVVNHTSSILHYENQETGHKFDVQANSSTDAEGGHFGKSLGSDQLPIDRVPWKSSGKRLVLAISDNGPQYAVCDDGWKFSVMSNGVEKWTSTFTDGAEYIIRVDDHGIALIKNDPTITGKPNSLKKEPAFITNFNDPGFIVTF